MARGRLACSDSGVVVMVMMMMMIVSGGGGEVAEAAEDCNTLVAVLAPCQPFVFNQVGEPSESCCNALGIVVQDNASCLCLVLSNPAGLPINITRAEQLPSLCNVSIPNNASLCPAASQAPSISPTPAPPKATSPTIPPPGGMPPGMSGMGPMGPTPYDSGSFASSSISFSFMHVAMSIIGTTLLMQLQA